MANVECELSLIDIAVVSSLRRERVEPRPCDAQVESMRSVQQVHAGTRQQQGLGSSAVLDRVDDYADPFDFVGNVPDDYVPEPI